VIACAACARAVPEHVTARSETLMRIRFASRGMDCVLASEAKIAAMGDRIRAVLAEYPERVLAASAIDEIDVCTRIARSTATGKNAVGVAHIGRGRISISLEAGRDLADVVHHEVFHMLDYERGAVFARSPDLERSGSRGLPRPWGYVTAYAKTNEIEDRASTFEFIMGRSRELCGIARGDPLVHAKTAAVWMFVADIAGDDSFLRERAPCVAEWIPPA
jgi:hypothetical protein